MIEFHELAKTEVREAQAWYAERSRSATEGFRSQLGAAIDRVLDSPDQFPNICRHFKYARIFGFPYIVVFRRRPDGVLLIVSIAHTSRRQNYWLHRD